MNLPEQLVTIQEAANRLGVSTKTLRRWEANGKLLPSHRTVGNQRRYTVEQIEAFKSQDIKASSIQGQESPTSNFKDSAPSFSEHIVKHTIRFINTTNVTIRIPHTIATVIRGVGHVLGRNDIQDEITPQSQAFSNSQLSGRTFPQEVRTFIANLSLPQKLVLAGSLGTLVLVSTAVGVTSLLPSLHLRGVPSFTTHLPGVPQAFDSEAQARRAQPHLEGETVGEVLGEQITRENLRFSINVPSVFNDNLSVGGAATFSASLTAPNLLYGIASGSGVLIGTGQTPSITNTGVLTLGGKAGELKLEAGTDITISDLKISNKSDLDTVRGRGGCTACVKDADVANDLTISSSGSVAGGAITADSLDFTQVADAMTLDAATSIGFGASSYALTFTNNGTGNMVVNLSSTGDFVIQDNGTTYATFNDAGNVILTGTLQIQSASALYSGTGVPATTIGANGDYYFRTDGTTSNTTLYYKTGGSWTAAGGGTLQNTYDVSSSPEFTVDTTRGGITIRDASTAIGANLLEVQNNAGSSTFFAVTTSGASTTDLSLTDSTPAISAATTNASLSINANGTGTIDIAGTSAGNVNLAGGSTDTGCTINNSTGALTCASDITAGATGTVGYWQRSGTTLSPATSGDIASLTSPAAATSDQLTVALTGVGSDAIQINLTQTDDADATDNAAALRLALTSNSGDADLLYGVDIGNITEGTATEVAFRIGSGWTNLIELEGATDDTIETFIQITDPASTDKTITFPNASGEVCLVAAGNCAGSGTGVTTTGGTTNTLAKFTGTQTIGNTTITDDGTVVTFTVDADLTFAAGENLSLTNTTASTDQISLSISGVTTSGADGIAIALTQADDADATDTNAGMNIAITSSSGDADTLYGINIAAITAGTAVETGLVVGSGWDYSATFAGSVGIGVTAPSQALHVVGQCVTGDTKLRRRRRRRKDTSDGGDEGDSSEVDWEWEDVRIDQINEGDEILTLDETTGEFTVSRVKALMDMGTKTTFRLVTEDGKEIRTTDNHPYLVQLAPEPDTNFLYDLSFETIKDFAYRYYTRVLAGQKIKVTALKDEVAITRAGWNHLQMKARNHFDLITRYFALPKVTAVLEKTDGIFRHNHRIENRRRVDYWEFREKIDGVEVKILIRSISRGPKHFYSLVWRGEEEANKKVGNVVSHSTSEQPQGMNTLQRQAHQMLYTTFIKDLSRHGIAGPKTVARLFKQKWVKVRYLKPGMEIATFGTAKETPPRWPKDSSDGEGIGDRLQWVKIKSIEKVGQEQVFDIEVEGTHNFVGNDIVAHNTFINSSTATGTALDIDANSLSSGFGLDVSSTSTAGTASSNSRLINLARSGANANASHTAYGLYSSVTNTGTTSTNIGGYFTASGATSNYAAIFDAGNVGIGTTAPGFLLEVGGTARINGAFTMGDAAADTITFTGSPNSNINFLDSTVGDDYTMRGSDATGGNNDGGALTMRGGDGFGNPGVGGAVNITGGTAPTGGAGGAVVITAGTPAGYTGGAITLQAGNGATGTSRGGALSLTSGAGNSEERGGHITVTSGAGGGGTTGGATTASGDITITSGSGGSTAGNSGTLTLDTGAVTSGTVGAINIGTSLRARTITIGNATGATALALTSGTGAQTFTSSVVSGTTTSSAFVLTDSALTSGTGLYLTGSNTTGLAVDIDANSLTTGSGLDISSTATAFNGELLVLSKTGASGSTAFTSDIAGITYSQTFNAAPGDSTGNVLDISRSITIDDGTAGAITGTVSGAMVRLADTCAVGTADTCTHTANVLELAQNFTSSSGTALMVTNLGGASSVSFRVNDETGTGDTTPFLIDSAGNVGIGTTGPSQLLEVSKSQDTTTYTQVTNVNTGTSAQAILRLANAATGVNLGYTGGSYTSVVTYDRQAGAYLESAGAGGLSLGATHASGIVTFNTGGTGEKVRIDTSGNVGIGTTAPAGPLHVVGDTDLGLILGRHNAAVSSPMFSFRKSRGTVGSPTVITSGDNLGDVRGFGYAGATSGYTLSSQIHFDTEGTIADGTVAGEGRIPGIISFFTSPDSGTYSIPERMRIDSAGNVGIGTTSPGAKLDVATSGVNAKALDLRSTQAQANNNSADVRFFIPTSGATVPVDETYYQAKISALALNTNNLTGALAFYTNYPHAVLAERMRITNDGNVKIANTTNRATTEGTNHLDIFDGTAPVGTLTAGISLYSTTGELRVMDSGGTATLLSPHDDSGNWIFSSNNTEAGKDVQIQMEKLMQKLDGFFGGGYFMASGLNYNEVAIAKIDANGIVSTGLGNSGSSSAVCSSLTSGSNPIADTAYELRDCNSTPSADYMEFYSVEEGLEVGDVVVPSATFVTTTTGERLAKLTKSSSAYQQSIIGIVSDKSKAGDFNSIGYNIKDEDNPQPVALSGRVPVKVSTENGEIKAGDFLTSSSIPGVAMRATKPGAVVGKALEPFDGSNDQLSMTNDQSSSNASNSNENCDIDNSLKIENCKLKIGRILVFVNVSFADPNSILANLVIGEDGMVQGDAPPASDWFSVITSEARFQTVPGEAWQSLLGGEIASGSASLRNDTLKGLLSRLDSLEEKVASLSALTTHLPGEVAPAVHLEGGILESTSSALLITDASVLGLTSENARLDSARQATVSGTLTVLGRTLLADVGITGTINAGLLTINGLPCSTHLPGEGDGCGASINTLAGDLRLQSLSLGGIDILAGKITIDKEGNVEIAKNLFVQGTATVGKLNVKEVKELEGEEATPSASIGEAVLPAGKTAVIVRTSAVTTKSRIFLTPKVTVSLPLAVNTQVEGASFTAALERPVDKDVRFNWWVVN